nr:anticoagulant protein rhipilin-2-like [Dermacentor andersoni]
MRRRYYGFFLAVGILVSKGNVAPPECAAGERNEKKAWICYEISGNATCRRRSYFYNRATDQCESFDYKGCGGNRNNFYSIEKCTADYRTTISEWDKKLLKYMKTRVNCSTTPNPKRTNGTVRRYYYNQTSERCRAARVAQGDIYFPAIRYCVQECQSKNNNLPRCALEKQLGTNPTNWTCERDPKYGDLVCYRPEKGSS